MPDILKTIGRYEILREIGRGAMAIVYLAHQTDLDRFVALKELGAFHGSDPLSAQRFLREWRVAGRLSYPNVVTVYDYFEHDGTPYIVMEYVERGSLRPYVGNLTLAQIGGVLEGLLAGLAHAQKHAIVHGDLKPENLMVTADGRVKIADFGIAKASSVMQIGAFLTASPTPIVGTPTYMAPEQAMALEIGPWTDLYSVGCMAFEMFTGRVPFHDSDAPMAILLRHVNEPIPSVRSVNPEVDQAISDWVEALLVKDPTRRSRSANDAWNAFEEIIIRLLGPRWRRGAPLTTVDTPKPLTPAPFEGLSTDQAPMEEFESLTSGAPDPADAAAEVKEDESGFVTFGDSAVPIPTDAQEPAARGPTEAPPAMSEPPSEAPAVADVPAPEEGVPAAGGAHTPPSPPPRRAPAGDDDDEDFQSRRPASADSPAPTPSAHPSADATVVARVRDESEVTAAPFPRVESAEPQAPRSAGRLRRLVTRMRKRSPPGTRPSGAEPTEPVVTCRTPHLDLSHALPLCPGAVFEVLVYADLLPARAGEDSEDVVLRAPVTMTSFRLDVWLVATHHFLVTDAPIKAITVRRHEPRSDTARFRVAVVAAPAQGEEPLISASFSCNGRPSGRVTRVIPIQGAGRVATKDTATAAPTLEVDLQAVAPDLVIEISAPENDGRRFEVRVDTPMLSLERRTESWFLPAEAPALVDAAMQQFFTPGASRSARLASLSGAGLELFDAAPALLKDAYWRLVDAGHKPRTFFVVSDERSIPWELMIPNRRTPGGDREVHRSLGTELAVGRWHRQSAVSPRQRVQLRTSYVVAPNYTTWAPLEYAAAEAEFVCRRFSGRRIDPARFDHLDLMLGDQGVDLLHFICHGEADEGGIPFLLLEEPDRLNPQQIRAMPGLSKACRESRPLVFLNACEVGRPARGLVGASGFAKSFIEIDASCVVGALWSVDDRTAHNVAVEFYEQILSNPTMPFAEALRRIRARGYAAEGEDTYAAYCFYGDPAASSA
jgi:serine/threonine protein kinase